MPTVARAAGRARARARARALARCGSCAGWAAGASWDVGRVRDRPQSAVEAVHDLHLLAVEERRGHPQVLRDAAPVRGLGDDDDVALYQPRQHELAGAHTLAIRELLDLRVRQDVRLAGGEGREGGDVDALRLAESDELALHQVRVDLQLVDHGQHLAQRQQVLQVLPREVGHPDGPGELALVDVLQRRPHLRALLPRRRLAQRRHLPTGWEPTWCVEQTRPVQQKKIDVAQPQVIQ
mmetsp:Transcript_100989/g.283086  ORF Transcript_100989/g.283086 Transcript_100989/m.283086 type:complete len:237 (+) Transcript_100989:213-923(+)